MANKLELMWYGKEQEISVEPRLLIERPEFSNTGAAPDTENMLIHGDNLLALKALESKYAGQVRCIYIDPPYNTGSAFEHYDDNLEHSQWLNLMRPRLEILKTLLADDGSIWISIDDDEGHYLKILCDEVFGRHNFISTVIWEKNFHRKMTQNGFLIVTTLFLYMQKINNNGDRIYFQEPLKWISDIKIQMMILAVRGHPEIVLLKRTVQALITQ